MSELQRGRRQISASSKEGKKFIPVVLLRLSSLLLALAYISSGVDATTYPRCWIKRGECLDRNVGPLKLNVTAKINPNIIAVVNETDTSDDCASACYENERCNYFTFYKNVIDDRVIDAENASCKLTGFNLGAPCFLLEKTCVLLEYCTSFNETCPTCVTGPSPLYDPQDEPLTIIVNGVTDFRDHQTNAGTDQYNVTVADSAELIMSETSTCTLQGSVGSPRFGSTAGFTADKVINCGGYDPAEPSGDYLATCLKLESIGADWVSTIGGDMTTKRAFATSVSITNLATNESVLYIMGGYNRDDGFLDTIEKFDSTAETWAVDGVTLPSAQSHFCAVDSRKTINEDRHLYMIGGWDIDYSNKVYRVKINDDASLDGTGVTGWSQIPSMNQARSDHACQEIQMMVNDQWKTGILVAGGYTTRGAWMKRIEFFDYEKGQWMDSNLLPFLSEGRHYNGLTTINMLPFVFGGWNNGSMNSFEKMDSDCNPDQREWVPQGTVLKLQAKREKFASTRIPRSFAPNGNCTP